MKNKFLILGLVSALFALMTLPSAFATETTGEVAGSIAAGSLTLTGAGAFDGSRITLNSLAAPPSTDSTVSFTTANVADKFTIEDATADSGNKLTFKLSSSDSGNFVYSGTSGGATNNISASRMTFIPRYSGSAAITANVVSGTSDVDATVTIITANTSNLSDNSTGSFTFDSSLTGDTFTKHALMNKASFNYVISSIKNPHSYEVRLDKMDLSIPAYRATGTYKSTLLVTLFDGV